ncbi:MAG: NADH-quinone oxidoreductase subunit A, partial [Opitutaceae bacterium]
MDGRHSKISDTAYECGIPGEGIVHTRFSVKFFVTALLFMLFDLEVVI